MTRAYLPTALTEVGSARQCQGALKADRLTARLPVLATALWTPRSLGVSAGRWALHAMGLRRRLPGPLLAGATEASAALLIWLAT